MFGLGFTEILVIMIVALLVFGPEKLPEMAKVIGKTLGELRKTADSIKRELTFPSDDSIGNHISPSKSEKPTHSIVPSKPTDGEKL